MRFESLGGGGLYEEEESEGRLVPPDLVLQDLAPIRPEERRRLDSICSGAGVRLTKTEDFWQGHRWECQVCNDVDADKELNKWWKSHGVAPQGPLCPIIAYVRKRNFYNVSLKLNVIKLQEDYWRVVLATWPTVRIFRCDGLRGVNALMTGTVFPLFKELADYEVRCKELSKETKEMNRRHSELARLAKVGG